VEFADLVQAEQAGGADAETLGLLLAGLAGLLLFCAFRPGITAAVAEPAMWIVSLILVAVACLMLLARHIWMGRYKEERERRRSEALSQARCAYCGGQNAPGTKKCAFCGAPLR